MFELVNVPGSATVLVNNILKDKYKDLISAYSCTNASVPYRGEKFQETFTLLKHNCDVLGRSNITPSQKGYPVSTTDVFALEYQDIGDTTP